MILLILLGSILLVCDVEVGSYLVYFGLSFLALFVGMIFLIWFMDLFNKTGNKSNLNRLNKINGFSYGVMFISLNLLAIHGDLSLLFTSFGIMSTYCLVKMGARK